MSEGIQNPSSRNARAIITILVAMIMLACIVGLVASVIVVAGEIPWHHLLTESCG